MLSGNGGVTKKPRPRHVFNRVRIAVSICRPNRGNGPPLVVGELGVPGRDECIGAGQIEQRERACVLRQREAARDRDLPCKGIPVLRRRRHPDSSEVGLFLCARRARDSSRPLSISMRSRAYRLLSSAGGPPGRNCAPSSRTNGLTEPHPGSSAALNGGGVGIQKPGPTPGV